MILVNVDPESANFGEIVQTFELSEGVLPHYLYYNHDQSRLYNNTLGGEFLYELLLERDADGIQTITEAVPVNTGDSIVGEDMFFSEDGDYFWATFIGGFGGDVWIALEFYIGPGDVPESGEDQLLYVSFAVPGVVNAYSLDTLPELELVKTFQPREARITSASS